MSSSHPHGLVAAGAQLTVPLSLLLAVAVALVLAVGSPAWGDDVDAIDTAQEGDATGTADAPPNVPHFEDTVDRAYNPAVIALVSEGVLRGCDTLRFCPDEGVTRGQMATMLVNALGLDPVAEGPFTDLEGSLHADNINAVAAAGISVGCTNNAFCPGDIVTRAQFATLLAGAFDLPLADERYFDGLSDTHGDYVNSLADAGITDGCTEPLTSYCGDEDVLRWHAASFVARAMGLVPTLEISTLEERRAEQERIDAQREAEAEAQRQAEEEARRAEEEARRAEEEAQRQAEYEAAAAERLAMWESLAECESNQVWNLNTGNGYYGGLQFLPETWWSVGGEGMPHQASKAEQIYRAERLLEKPWATFSNQWPACSRLLGLG